MNASNRHDGPFRSDDFMEATLARWGGAVYRLALSQTRSVADAEDVVQDVFLALFRSAVEFRDDGHVKAWLLHVAANRCRELHRAAWTRRVEPRDDMTSLAGTQDAAEKVALAALDRHPVWEVLAELPESQRMAVHLRYVEDCSVAEVARIMGCSPVTVRTRLFRARKRLAERLGAGADELLGADADEDSSAASDTGGGPAAPNALSNSD